MFSPSSYSQLSNTLSFFPTIIFLLSPYETNISNLSIRNVENPNLVIDLQESWTKKKWNSYSYLAQR